MSLSITNQSLILNVEQGRRLNMSQSPARFAMTSSTRYTNLAALANEQENTPPANTTQTTIQVAAETIDKPARAA